MFWLFFSIQVICFTFLGNPNNVSIKEKQIKILFRILLVVSLSLLICFGNLVGTDHSAYLIWYNNFDSNNLSSILASLDFGNMNRMDDVYEIGFLFLGFILKTLGISSIGFFFVVACITNAFLVNVLYRFKHPVFCIILFIISQYYFQECNLVRQMLATSVFLYALKYLETKQVMRYIIWILVATLFHYSAVFLLIFVFFCYINIQRWWPYLLLVLFVLWTISLLVASELFNIDFLFGSFSIDYYQIYFDNFYGEGHEERVLEIRYNIIVFVVLLFSLFELFKKRSAIKERYIYIFVFVLGAFLVNTSLRYYWFYRIAVYFATIFCFVVPEFLRNIKFSKNEKNFSFIELGVILFYLYDLIIKYIANPDVLLGSKFYGLYELH